MEAEDFMEVPAPKFFRLFPGNEVRLRYAYFLTCTGVIKDADGNVTELRATYDPLTAGGQAPDGRKVKTTLHWVSAEHAAQVEVREYAHLFTDPNPGGHEGKDPLEFLNPESVTVLHAQVEPALAAAATGEHVQFERLGYFCADNTADQIGNLNGGGSGNTEGKVDTGRLVFHRTVTLKDEWARIQKRS